MTVYFTYECTHKFYKKFKLQQAYKNVELQHGWGRALSDKRGADRKNSLKNDFC